MKSLEYIRSNEMNEFREYSNDDLIDLSKNWKSQSLYLKLNEFILPAFREQDRNLARQVLSERGINYQKENNTQKISFKDVVSFTKDLFYGLFNLISNPYNSRK